MDLLMDLSIGFIWEQSQYQFFHVENSVGIERSLISICQHISLSTCFSSYFCSSESHIWLFLPLRSVFSIPSLFLSSRVPPKVKRTDVQTRNSALKNIYISQPDRSWSQDKGLGHQVQKHFSVNIFYGTLMTLMDGAGYS